MYRTVVVITSEDSIPDRQELENIVVGVGNGCCWGEIEIGESKWEGIRGDEGRKSSDQS